MTVSGIVVSGGDLRVVSGSLRQALGQSPVVAPAAHDAEHGRPEGVSNPSGVGCCRPWRGSKRLALQPRLGLRLCRSLLPSICPVSRLGSSSAEALTWAFVGRRSLAALSASSSPIRTNLPGATLTRFMGTSRDCLDGGCLCLLESATHAAPLTLLQLLQRFGERGDQGCTSRITQSMLCL